MIREASRQRQLWWWPLSNCWRGLRLVGDQVKSGHPTAARAAYLLLRAGGFGPLRARWLLVRPFLEAEADARQSGAPIVESIYRSRLEDALQRQRKH